VDAGPSGTFSVNLVCETFRGGNIFFVGSNWDSRFIKVVAVTTTTPFRSDLFATSFCCSSLNVKRCPASLVRCCAFGRDSDEITTFGRDERSDKSHKTSGNTAMKCHAFILR